jgi:hypothetical protein
MNPIRGKGWFTSKLAKDLFLGGALLPSSSAGRLPLAAAVPKDVDSWMVEAVMVVVVVDDMALFGRKMNQRFRGTKVLCI